MGLSTSSNKVIRGNFPKSEPEKKGRKKAVMPEIGDIWVLLGPAERWKVERVYQVRNHEIAIVKKQIKIRVKLCLADEPKITKDLAVSTLKNGMKREDLYEIFSQQVIQKIHAELEDVGKSPMEIAGWDRYFDLDTEKLKPKAVV